MSTRVIIGQDGFEVMYDSVTMRAFGPVHYPQGLIDGLDEFIDWYRAGWNKPPSLFTDYLMLNAEYHAWRKDVRKELEHPNLEETDQ
jgi:hypothetical protein